ncbi:MlaD family protein [Streptomyces sp. NPDC005202]|uniref:MlaD family protein n=1 Tax=Streptomyces sp. NPDC005202 TaxID=3157021 RepID=UPI0033AABB9C
MTTNITGRKTILSKARVIAAVIFVSVTAIASWGIHQSSEPNGTLLTAEFADASPLLVRNDVKVDGVKVGEIAEITAQDGKADVTMELNPEALPLHNDAKVTIRPVSLLGERYLELDRGTPSAPVMAPGAKIPVERTARNTDLDEVLNTVDDPTGQSLAALITMLGEGARGNGANIQATIKALGPAMRDTDGLVKILNEQNKLLNNVVDNVGPVAAALARDEGKTLDGLVGSAHQLLGTTSEQQQAFEATLAELPSTLNEARSTLAQVVGTANSTTPMLKSLRPTTDNLAQISNELKQFADSADPALASAQPVLDKAQGMLDQAQPVAAELRKAGPDLASSIRSANPLVSRLTKNISAVMAFIRNWALCTTGHDGVSHYFRGRVIATPFSATGTVPGLKGDLGVGRLLTTGKGKPHQQQPLPSPGLLSPQPQPDGGVTGLSKQQESGALGFLVGGS